MNKDQMILEEMYTQMYTENWKHKLLGGAAALGLGAAGVGTYNAMKHNPDYHSKKPESHPIAQVSHTPNHYKLTFDSARSTKELNKLIRDYYISKGHDVDVSIMNNKVELFDREQNKSVNFPLEDLQGSIKMGQNEGDPEMVYKYLNTWIN